MPLRWPLTGLCVLAYCLTTVMRSLNTAACVQVRWPHLERCVHLPPLFRRFDLSRLFSTVWRIACDPEALPRIRKPKSGPQP